MDAARATGQVAAAAQAVEVGDSWKGGVMSQASEILNSMRLGREVTGLSALNNFGCMRLSARILDLKEAGYPVVDRWIDLPSGKRVKAYRMDTGQMALV